MNAFVQRHQEIITNVLSCFDRVIITGTLPDIGYTGAMAGYLSYHSIRLFDYPRWAEPLRDKLRDHAEQLANKAGIEIEFIRRHKAFRKEDRIKAIIAERGDHPGLVHIFSAMEACSAYRPWYDKKKGHALLKPRKSNSFPASDMLTQCVLSWFRVSPSRCNLCSTHSSCSAV